MQIRGQISRKLHGAHEAVDALLTRFEQALANDLQEKSMKMPPVDYFHQFYADTAAERAAIYEGNAQRLLKLPVRQ